MKAPTLFLAIALLAGAMPVIGDEAPVFSTGAGAIDGYDPVAYFTVGKAVKGLEEVTYEWNGAKWHFSNVENREKFRGDPEKFAPEFGGYCAYAMTDGTYAAPKPEVFVIRDGALYLHYNEAIRKTWLKNVKGFIVGALENWQLREQS